jgi:glycosyltransferase involved in cell wall biosynthesis
MGEGPLASVVIDNYNYGHYLGQAIDSALAQTYPRTEVVVVDDGSTDDSRAVIASYGGRVRAVLKANGGQASAFNAGLAACRGEVVVFLDADDYLLPAALERAVPLLADPAVAKVHWPLWVIDSQGHRTGGVYPAGKLAKGDLRAEVIRTGPTSSVNASTSGNAWPRRFLEAVAPVQECGDKHGADAYLFTLAPIFGLIRCIPEPLGCYRIHRDAFSRHTAEANLRRDLRRFDHHCRVVCEYLRKTGVEADPRPWKGPGTAYAWMRDMLAALEELAGLIPPGETLILVDEGTLGGTAVPGRRVLPFLEKDGQYWGAPPDDDTAVRELERLREPGARFMAFVWSTFWWLQCYPGLAGHLRAHFRCVLDNERLLVFELRP